MYHSAASKDLAKGASINATMNATPRSGWSGSRWLIVLCLIGFGASLAIFVVLDARSPGQRWAMLDLQIYRWGGSLARHSGNIYSGHFTGYHLRFTYPPISALAFAALSLIHLAALKWIVTISSISALIIALWITLGSIGYKATANRIALTLGAVAATLWLQPVQETLSFGQVNIILMLMVIADLCAQRRPWPKGVGVGLAAGFKLTPLIFVPYMLLTRQYRAAAVAMATFLLSVFGPFILLPGQSNNFWFHGLFMNSHRAGNNAYAGNQSLNGALARLAGSVQAAHPYWLVCAVVIGVLGLALATGTARRGQQTAGVLICSLTGLLISPVSWSHHWVWAAPAFVVAVNLITGNDNGNKVDQAPSVRRNWIAHLGIIALTIPFFVLPQSLVSVSVAQGTGQNLLQLALSDLYVLVGLALMGWLVVCQLKYKRAQSNTVDQDRTHVVATPPHPKSLRSMTVNSKVGAKVRESASQKRFLKISSRRRRPGPARSIGGWRLHSDLQRHGLPESPVGQPMQKN